MPEIDEDELRRLVARRATIERQTFVHPPPDWAGFNQRLGRWMEVNDSVRAIESQINAANADEENE